MNETTNRAPVHRIRLRRAEGATNYRWVTVTSWAEANSQLRTWSTTAPKDGGYDKCDFEVEWASGAQYAGRYDLQHYEAARVDLAGHVASSALFYTARRQPGHMTPAHYKAFLAGHKRVAAEYDRLLAWCDLGIDLLPQKLFTI